MALLASACSLTDSETIGPCQIDPQDAAEIHDGSWEPAPVVVDGLSRLARTEEKRFLISTADGEAEFIVGVNLGATAPGGAPGELALGREDYRRWFPQMTAMGIRALRIYTIHPPEFYEELASYNRANPGEPLYVIHGAWIPQAAFLETRDLFDVAVRDGFRAEMTDAVGVVHGDRVLPERLGHASGTYTADISPWLIGWVIGVEWDPEATSESDEINSGQERYRGTYFESARGSSPTETWLAEMLDHLAAEEAARGWTGPVAFVNWPTTDPLAHPEEPIEEDMVGVDANNVRHTESWPGGYFVNYHAYPYYPDFMRYQPGIADCDYLGVTDPYAGYLAALRDHHGELPVMITEFGVPSAAGSAHRGPLGRNQGGLSEQEAMAINADLLEIIHHTGMAGGFYFEWTDEWFKRTWNTMDYELPEGRRSLWLNPWTNEAHFGLLAVEPGREPVVIIDGDGGEWLDNDSQVILESRTWIREVRAVKDEAFLYLRLVLDEDELLDMQTLTIGIDVLKGGAGGIPGHSGIDPDADYAVTLEGDDGQIWVKASNDPHAIIYGKVHGYFDVDDDDIEEGSGVWNPHQLITNHPHLVPSTGETLEMEVFPVGEMVLGSSDPTDPAFDSRTTWAAEGRTVELRLPYQAIGFSDPSSLQAYRIEVDGTVSTRSVDQVGITVSLDGQMQETKGYAWAPWQAVEWRERPKAGLSVFTDLVAALNGSSP